MDRAGALSKKAVMPYLTLMLISKAIRLSNLPPFQLMMPIAVGEEKKCRPHSWECLGTQTRRPGLSPLRLGVEVQHD